MQFAYTILYVSDVQRAVEFYETAFGLPRRFIHESGQYAELDTGATTLAFAANELARSNLPRDFRQNSPDAPPAGIEIAFTTTDVPAAYRQAVTSGAEPLAEPATKPWGQQVAYVRDLEGVLVELASPVGA
jgi:uncharacterized glyoxalase superfamily protein PhnB